MSKVPKVWRTSGLLTARETRTRRTSTVRRTRSAATDTNPAERRIIGTGTAETKRTEPSTAQEKTRTSTSPVNIQISDLNMSESEMKGNSKLVKSLSWAKQQAKPRSSNLSRSPSTRPRSSVDPVQP